jgi:uncharacterized protein (DUF1800 family)
MKKLWVYLSFISLSGGLLLTSFLPVPQHTATNRFPYRKAGLTERQAAAHLLSRFTYGATPGEVDAVVKMGLENWFQQQLSGTLPDYQLNERLTDYDAINMSNSEVCKSYPPGFVIVSLAIKDSVISKDSVGRAVNKKDYNDQIQAYMQKKGFKSDQDLYKQFIDQNILRAVYSNNQLQEVVTDFWFNHFNVSFTKGECAQFIPAYERDVMRPNALGKFDSLLLATARSPAMLYFLDNFTSVGAPVAPPSPAQTKPASAPAAGADTTKKTQPVKNLTGLNENYAREVMELHTLGVDGGYTQQDVTQAARVFTGWTIYPISDVAYGSAMKGLVAKIGEKNLASQGFVHEGDFLFTPTRHDKGEKIVLGHHFAANGGYQEGVDLLEILAHHPSTARFIARKLAVRFISDNPPQSIIDKMARSFTAHDGDIREVLLTMASSREFWDRQALREKTKSPFELAISAVRSLNADIKDPYQLYNWITRMGQRVYYYQAPTGFPDKGQYWINTGALLSRMNFSLALASQRITGIKVDLAALTDHHEPESASQALVTYSQLFMPERQLDKTIKQLTPLLTEPDLAAKIEKAGGGTSVSTPEKPTVGAPGDMMMMSAGRDGSENKPAQAPKLQNAMLSQVVGIIIGSPEFQRR